MSKKLRSITPAIQHFISRQHIFFVGTATTEGRINVSPKGMDSFRVVSPNKVIWLNLTGSGNETATHVHENSRMTIMFCAFEGKPMILRLYGNAVAYHFGEKKFAELNEIFPEIPGKRQIFEMNIDLVQTSCGFAVPLMKFESERTILKEWAEKKGEEGIRAYWNEKNSISLDGHNTYLGQNTQEGSQ